VIGNGPFLMHIPPCFAQIVTGTTILAANFRIGGGRRKG
jgi:hypothetical protein